MVRNQYFPFHSSSKPSQVYLVTTTRPREIQWYKRHNKKSLCSKIVHCCSKSQGSGGADRLCDSRREDANTDAAEPTQALHVVLSSSNGNKKEEKIL